MARRIRWQIIVAVVSTLIILTLLGHLALSTASEGGPEAGGTYVEAVVVPDRQLRLNPLRQNTQRQAEADISQLIFDGLTRPNIEGNPLPVLVEQPWEESADGKVYTFTLRSGITWHDGQPLTTADVVFSYRMLADPDFTSDQRLLSVWRNVLVEAIDERRVRFQLAQSFAPFLSHTSIGIVPAHLFQNGAEKDPAAWERFERQPIGTGPYRLASLTESEAQLEVYQAHHDPTDPFLDHVVFRFYDNPEAAQNALTRREVQGFAYNLSEHGELPLPARAKGYRAPLADYTLLTLNLRTAPLDDLSVRKALATGLDKQLLIQQALGGNALKLDTPILSSSWAAPPLLTWYQPNVAEARRLLAEAGWEQGPDGLAQKAGQPLTLTLLTIAADDRLAVAAEIQRQWREIGVQVTIEQVSADQLRERLSGHNFTLALHSWLRLGSDPDIYEFWHSSQTDRSNYAGLSDQTLDALIASARQVSDTEQRQEFYAEALKRWVELAPSIILYQPLYEEIVAQEVIVAGLTPSGLDAPVLYSPDDRFRFVPNWGISTTRQIRSDLRNQTPQRSR
jgi:peptide/nickel transport system substrate-binding protein